MATVTGVQATEVQSLACALPVGLPTAKGACATKTNLEIDKHMPAPKKPKRRRQQIVLSLPEAVCG